MGALGFDSGRVCLDLVATGEGPALGSARGLRGWVYDAGLVPAGIEVGVAADWLGPFLTLRGRLERMVGAELGGLPQAAQDVAGLNEAARPAPPAPAAVLGEAGTLTKGLAGAPGCEQLLAVVARDAVELFTDPVARAQLRRCEGENCPRVYLDTSRGGRRRWCSSEVCGNRERVARHRRRTTLRTTRG
ncbi:CGNR zinc finger domain-containing protein [Streptomyces sp. NBC_01476]|uniref:CGNR zinc finger domain-containing protein n=1 Tax=Streptomyces sp. NBC_01476 TaxID=2903881 RepID=UPI002E303AED|nr:CGNR zinc finger domain-containing protein [Streptomyces sp. NBC_01476]